jgi:small-conductance mechanosensitive channel
VFDSVTDRLSYLALALAVLLAFVALAWLVRWGARTAIRRYDPSLAQMTAGLSSIALLLLGVLLALWIAIPSVRFGTIFTSLGVTGLILGFALKDIIENFVSGIIILWRRPFRVGDQIGSGSFEGNVEEINFRSTVLRTFDGIRVYIPNGTVLTQPVENFTSYTDRRATVELGIDQAASIERAREVILGEMPRIPGVLTTPEPLVLFESVGEFTNNLEVVYWTRPPTRLSDRITRSGVTERLFTSLQEAGISFPYPIRSVRLVGRSE